MSRVVFRDVVKRINVNVDRHNTERLYYVGGEHIDSCELLVTKHGLIEGSTIGFKFHFGFEPGHILFMSRNPHLRKASMATFSGICSDSTYVVETRDENVLLQKYLLLEMQSDRFWEWAEANKSGGVNYLINYKTLDSYEFDLPSLAEQKVLAEKLWAAYEVKQSYLKMIAATEEMVKAQFVEMFGNTQMLYKIGDLFQTCSGGTPNRKKSEYFTNGEIPWVTSGEINKVYIESTDSFITELGLENSSAKWVPENSVLIAMYGGGTVGKVGLLKIPATTNQAICALLPNNDYNPLFTFYMMKMKEDWMASQARGAAQENISQNFIKSIMVPKPSKEMQDKFVSFAEQAGKSISELRKSIDAIDKVIKSLINENL